VKIHSHRIHPNQAYLNLIKIHRLSLLLDSTAAAAAAAAQDQNRVRKKCKEMNEADAYGDRRNASGKVWDRE